MNDVIQVQKPDYRMSSPPDKDGTFFYVLQDALKIIFVDDDPILREFAVVNLTTEHATVATAADGEEALRVIEAFEPDIMLLDLEMPNMDGFEVLERLRASETWRRLPVIVVTGREDVGAVDRAFQAGATSFVVKPLNWRLLSYQIRYVQRAAVSEAKLAAQIASGDAARQLERLALESSRFLTAALAQQPSLRPLAAEFARVADAVLSPPAEEAA
jgi:DNA-binding response OmpR family regulator